MKLSEFANVYKVSERHVRRLIKKYESDMVGHYVQKGNEGTFIDDVGVDILKSKLKAQFDIVEAEASEDEKRLNEQLILALAKCTTLAEQLADAEKRAGQNAAAGALLESAKMNVAQLEARAGQAEERALEAEKKAEEASRQAVAATQKKLETELALEEAKERAEAAEDVAELNAQEAERAKAESAELRAKLEQIAAARGFKRRKLLKELKKKEERHGG